MSICAQHKSTYMYCLCFCDMIGMVRNFCNEGSMKKKKLFVPVAAFCAVFICSCATMTDYDYTDINIGIRNGDYNYVYNDLQRNEKKLYTSRDEVLKLLDEGVLSHFAGDFDRSNKELSEAEKKIAEFYAKSVSQTVTSFLANDTVMDYSGDTYENIYTNVFMALNYLDKNDSEDAFVEIRRFDNKLKEITQKYQVLLAEEKRQMENGSETVPEAHIEFHNSALARYLSMIMYRSSGADDSAEVDRKKIKSAFELQPNLYGFPEPASIQQEIEIPKGMARLNIISFTGRAPIKVENVLRVNLSETYYKLALPEMKKQPTRIASAIVTAVSRTDGSQSTADIDKLESIENIAIDTFQQSYSLIFAKTLVRSLSKSAATLTFDRLSRDKDNDNQSLFRLLKVASEITTEATERADVRTSRFFPATASVAGLTLIPGVYDIRVTYYDPAHSVVAVKNFPGKDIRSGELNLLESVCQQ